MGDDTISGCVGSDTLYGDDGNDFFTVVDDHDYDSVDGGLGLDTFAAGNFVSTSGIAVTFTDTGAGTYDYLCTKAAGDFSNIEVISGTAYADNLSAAADTAGVVLQGDAGKTPFKAALVPMRFRATQTMTVSRAVRAWTAFMAGSARIR